MTHTVLLRVALGACMLLLAVAKVDTIVLALCLAMLLLLTDK
jgi:hypothetical protein